MGKLAIRLQLWRLRHARSVPATVRGDLAAAGPSPRERGERFLGEDEVAAAIDAAIAARRPFSFLRLGDGEGALLGFARDATEEDLRYFLAHFDRPRAPAAIWRLRASLLAAIDAADIVGIRDDVWNAEGADGLDPEATDFLEGFKACFPLRTSETNLHEHGALRIFRLYEWWRRSRIPGAFCSQWVHADLQVRGYFDDLIASQKRIGLVTNAVDLPERIRRRFGVEVTAITVPGNRRNPGVTGAPSQASEQHFGRAAEIAASIPRNLDGMVFLVGAGLVGKQYCTMVKANGGVALDLGALLDAWDGRATRGMVHRSKATLTASRFAPPPAFLLGHGPVRKARPARKIILHAGLARGGGDALHQRLRGGAAELASSGIRYAGEEGGVPDGGLAHAIASGDRAALTRILAGLDTATAGPDPGTLLISSPDLASFTPHRAVEDTLLDWLLRNDVTILLALRPQFDWLAEWHRHLAERGETGLFLDEFLDDPENLPGGERFDGNFLRRLAYFRRYMPEERVVALLADESGDRILCHIGLDPARLPLAAPAAGPTESELAGRVLARRRDRSSGGEATDRVFLRGAWLGEREARRQTVSARFADSNRELHRLTGIDLETNS